MKRLLCMALVLLLCASAAAEVPPALSGWAEYLNGAGAQLPAPLWDDDEGGRYAWRYELGGESCVIKAQYDPRMGPGYLAVSVSVCAAWQPVFFIGALQYITGESFENSARIYCAMMSELADADESLREDVGGYDIRLRLGTLTITARES